MKCPNCGSNLSVKGKFCPYCGTAIPDDVSIKIDTHQEILDHAKVTKAQEEGKTKIAREKTKRGCLTVIVVLIFAFVALAIYADYSDKKYRRERLSDSYSSPVFTSESQKRHNVEVERLRKIEDEILEDIRNERYEQALIKAQTLYYADTYSQDTKKAWDNKRESLIRELTGLIEKK